MKDNNLTYQIIGCAYKVHNTLGSGFLEKVYENALRVELTKQGFSVKQQEPIKVYYESEIVGEYFADLWIENQIIFCESCKSCLFNKPGIDSQSIQFS